MKVVDFQSMQQNPTSVIQLPSKKQYVIRGLVYSLVGVALLGLAIYLNSFDVSMFTDPSSKEAFTVFGCLSGVAFVVGIIVLFIPVMLWQSYRHQLELWQSYRHQFAAPYSPAAQQPPLQAKGTAPERGEIAALLGSIMGVLGWIFPWRRMNRAMALGAFFTFVGFLILSRSVINLNLPAIGAGLAATGLGLGVRILGGGLDR